MAENHSQRPARGQLAAVILGRNQRLLEGRQPYAMGVLTVVTFVAQ